MTNLASQYEISYSQVINKDYVLSPSSLGDFNIKNKNLIPLRNLIDQKDKGEEVGSFAYINKSNKFFIRNKALKRENWIIFTKGKEEIIPINPSYFKPYNLEEGDILISKDSNIGEAIILQNNQYKENYMISGGIIRLKISKNRLYVFSVIKNDFFIEQLRSMTPKGATLRHAKEAYLECKIPFPNGKSAKLMITKIEKLAENIIKNENEIIIKYNLIIKKIGEEIIKNQNSKPFNYDYPTLETIRKTYRLDAAIYGAEYLKQVFLVKNYKLGYSTLEQLGFRWKRGSSLEIKGLGVRVNSASPKDGFKALILPTNISEYGTLDKLEYIGVKKDLVKVNKGDIVFGGEATRRLFVLCDDLKDTVTNYHGIKIWKENEDLTESLFVWAFLSYWKDLGVLDYIAVGGQGGHLAPEYFDYLIIPKFPISKIKEITELYHNAENSGIYQLHSQNNAMKNEVDSLVKRILNDKEL